MSTQFPCSPWHPISVGCALIIREPWDSLACLGSDSVGWALIIRLIIQTILLYPSGALWTDEAPNVSRLDPSGAVQIDADIRLVIGRSSVW